MKITVWERSTRRLSPSVRVALSKHAEKQLPERVAGLFDFVEEQEGQFQLIGMRSRQRFLGDQGMSFTVAEIARR